MALFDMHYYSNALKMQVELYVILPEVPKSSKEVGAPEGKYKTLYLLHGLSGDHSVWLRRSSIERYADKHSIAVVMPNVARSWYANTAYGADYFTFVLDELPTVCRSYFKGMSDLPEDNYVGGLSMGGYGALKLALTHPERYAGCISLSGALDITRKGRSYILEEWQGNFGFGIDSALDLEGGENDLFALLEKRVAEGAKLPSMYIWCGTEDTLLPVNREFSARLNAHGIDHVYEESPGDHVWECWDAKIKDSIKYFFG